jgi:hypothetical protein
VPYFSNPELTYPGTTNVMGDATDGDNARTIREMRTVIADYRDAPDKDYDGLPNEWEQQYFGGETNAISSEDTDNDGFSNLQEYISGFNPTNAASFFSTTNFLAQTNGFVVQWQAVSGRVYSINWTTNLLNSFQSLETNILWPQSSYTDTLHRFESEGFYRIRVDIQN